MAEQVIHCKNPLAMKETRGLQVGSLVQEDSPGKEKGNPLQCSCLGNPMDRSLVGYSPRGHKESDKSERLRERS